MTSAGPRQPGQDRRSLLLLSNSTTHAQPYLSHALEAIAAHLSGRERLLFVPYALANHDGYTATVAEAMRPIGVSVEGVHRLPDPASAVSSAGTNLACPTIRTTNDMPIVDPEGFDALGLIPFQINPHYIDPDPGSRHQGETRAQRLTEFCEENDVPVLAMREGAWLQVDGDVATLRGANGALLFRHGHQPAEIGAGTDVSWLLATLPRFTIRG
jgi:dipeptidase E